MFPLKIRIRNSFTIRKSDQYIIDFSIILEAVSVAMEALEVDVIAQEEAVVVMEDRGP